MALYEALSEVEVSLQYVAMALSTATLGASNDDVQLMSKSQQAYGLAMQQMAISFVSPTRNKDGILAAIQLMRVYEVRSQVCHCNGSTDGLIAIIRYRNFRSSAKLACVTDQGLQKTHRWGDCPDIESRPRGFLVFHGKTAAGRRSSNLGKFPTFPFMDKLVNRSDQRLHLTAEKIPLQ
jgi:hypothetical protein